MRTSLDGSSLASYVTHQLNATFPDKYVITDEMLMSIMPAVLERVEHCFSRINNKHFFDGKSAVLNHLHGDQNAMLLYLMANEAHRARLQGELPTKLYLLNRALNGIEAYYEVELPSVFLFVHPHGTVLGRAKYGDYFLVYQRCGVGSNHDIYPELGEFVTLRPGATVLGRSRIGRNCTVAAESLVLDRIVPDDTIYIGGPRDFVTRKSDSVATIWRA